MFNYASVLILSFIWFQLVNVTCVMILLGNEFTVILWPNKKSIFTIILHIF